MRWNSPNLNCGTGWGSDWQLPRDSECAAEHPFQRQRPDHRNRSGKGPARPALRTGAAVSENTHPGGRNVWSDADGNYLFELIDPAQRYTVVSYDYR